MYCRYGREDRKKLHKQRVIALNGFWKGKFSAWNKIFKNLSDDVQDVLWETHFPKKEWDVIKQKYITPTANGVFDCCKTAAIPKESRAVTGCTCWECNEIREQEEQEEENTMRSISVGCAPASYANAQIASSPSEIETQRKYLLDRLSNTMWTKRADERKPFGLEDDDAPKTTKERKARIAAGKYIIDWEVDEDEYDDEEREYYGVGCGRIRWRDPAVKEDRKGYDAAMAKMEKDLPAIRDIIQIKSADDGLKALQEFETRTYH